MRSPTLPSVWRLARRGAWLGLLLAVLTQAPARWLADGVSALSQQRWQWRDARGTVWQGSARWWLSPPIATDAAPARALPGRVHWQLSPARWGLAWTLEADCCTAQPLHILLRPLWRGVALELGDQPSDWPADWLQGLGAPWNTVQPEGRLRWQSHDLQWRWQAGTPSLQGHAELELRDLATRLSPLRPLGSYRLRLDGGDTIRFELDTRDGALRLSGEGQWQPRGLYFLGEASAAPAQEAVLSNLLNVLGQRRGAKAILQIGQPS